MRILRGHRRNAIWKSNRIQKTFVSDTIISNFNKLQLTHCNNIIIHQLK